MKKRMIMILVATCFMVVSGCGAAGVSQEVKTAETAADTQTVSEHMSSRRIFYILQRSFQHPELHRDVLKRRI